MTWRQLVRLAKKEYGLKKLIWTKRVDYAGLCNGESGKVWLSRKHCAGRKNFNDKIATFFHELGHIYCVKNGLWENYHNIHTDAKKKKVNTSVRVALKAERWVDDWATKEMKKYFPKIKHHRRYYLTDVGRNFKKEWRKSFENG